MKKTQYTHNGKDVQHFSWRAKEWRKKNAAAKARVFSSGTILGVTKILPMPLN